MSDTNEHAQSVILPLLYSTTTSAVGIFSPSGSPYLLHSRLLPVVDIIPAIICDWLAAPWREGTDRRLRLLGMGATNGSAWVESLLATTLTHLHMQWRAVWQCHWAVIWAAHPYRRDRVRVRECWHPPAIFLYNIHAFLHSVSLISWVSRNEHARLESTCCCWCGGRQGCAFTLRNFVGGVLLAPHRYP